MNKAWIVAAVAAGTLTSCYNDEQKTSMDQEHDFQWKLEQFEDISILRYRVPGWEQLTPEQRIYAYHLTEAGLAGRDIMYAMNYRHNLEIRSALDHIVAHYEGDREASEWEAFHTYAKRVWFANGIHHHYSNQKIEPGFSGDYLDQLLSATGAQLSAEAREAMLDPNIDPKKVNKESGTDLVLTSAVNFYGPDVTQKEVEAFYGQRVDKSDPQPVWHGLNSRIVRAENGGLAEEVYRIGGLYSEALEHVVHHLTRAMEYAENPAQAEALKLLIDYYHSGDLRTWDEYNIAWLNATGGDIDYINGFVEVYNDPLGYKGSYETIVQIRDFDASERMSVLSRNAQWFEDNSPIMDEHKKDSVRGITYNIVTVVGEAGDASPSTPIGVNLPNSDWIRAEHGSKSVSLGNIEDAYNKATGKGLLKEFAFSTEERERALEHGDVAGKMHTALHEVIGHASGRLNQGVGTPKQTLKEFSSTLEEARADLVSLYYITDPYLVELGLVENDEVGKAEYDGYIRNGLMLQLRRIKPGEDLEQDHMRNRQLVASWVYDKGRENNVIERKVVDGKTYFVINNYEEMRQLVGQLLREIQRIKSEGDYSAARKLVKTYGIRVDRELHAEVLRRSAELNIPPYSGFVNPVLTPVMEGDAVVDVEISYVDDFTGQMLEYAKRYGYLSQSVGVQEARAE